MSQSGFSQGFTDRCEFDLGQHLPLGPYLTADQIHLVWLLPNEKFNLALTESVVINWLSASMAEWIEHLPNSHEVAGSIPAAGSGCSADKQKPLQFSVCYKKSNKNFTGLKPLAFAG
ncbi:hypothetical protein EVAR_71017_1 [Eumeta japonica]|uniref:Uncharacterized protein n=1 Tax=Eumeta variegata TaxID=151549 RepID=A0A4C1T1L8_EUMVA|nr:hypothetical protein EVAR_71017_1 [Eumeta japonica]